jgi:glycosyltransferase involved in cell wall biosynthesis
MQEKNFKISVIICSYNRADYIIAAIDSLYQQTLSREEFEVLVVDNNSIDNTSELVQAYIISHPGFSPALPHRNATRLVLCPQQRRNVCKGAIALFYG